MHDWTLRKIGIDWQAGSVVLELLNRASEAVRVKAFGLVELRVPRGEPWGPSVSVNAIVGPTIDATGLRRFEMEMQSGDKIEIVAKEFDLPTRE